MSENINTERTPNSVDESLTTEFDLRIPTLITERTQQTIRAFQVLVDHGDAAVKEQSKIEPGLPSIGEPRFYNQEGVILYDGADPRIAVPVLSEIYKRLGVTDIRVGAIPTITSGEHGVTQEYTIPILSDVNLMEEQTIFPDGSIYYELFGHNSHKI